MDGSSQGLPDATADLLQLTVRGCTAAHRRLEQSLQGLHDSAPAAASLLPGWTVGHVLTHLARNAESHVRMLEAAMQGQAVEQYPGGHDQRNADIEAGSSRSAADIRDDVAATAAALEGAWERMTAASWQGQGLTRGQAWPVVALPFHRWREVELHHADLGLAYSSADWPEEYVALELPLCLESLPERTHGADARWLLAWLVGRASQPADLAISPWQAYYHRLPPGLGMSS